MAKVKKTCRCGKVYEAREADLKRGWGKSCSKRCAAKKRTASEASGNHKLAAASKKYRYRNDSRVSDAHLMEDPSWDAHKLITNTFK